MKWLSGLIFSCFVCAAAAQVGMTGGKGPGRLVQGFGDLGNHSEAFIDHMKMCHDWQPNVAFAWPPLFDDNGFLTTPLPAGKRMFCVVPLTPSDVCNSTTCDWILDWTGKIGDAGTTALFISQPTSVTSTTGAASVLGATTSQMNFTGTGSGSIRFHFTTAPASVNLNVTDTANPSGWTSLRLYPASEDPSTGYWSPVFLSSLRTLNPKIIRHMGWQNISNHVDVSRFSLDTPVAKLSYWSDMMFPSSVWGGTLTYNSGTNAYSIAAPPGWAGLVDGATVQAWNDVGNSNTAGNPTLNVGGTGDILIGKNSTTWAAVFTGGISASSLRTFVYEAALNIWTVKGGGLSARVPTNVLLDLCNQLKTDCWMAIWPWYDNNSITSFVQDVRDNLDPSLSAYFEWSNEVWNTAFVETSWAAQRGLAIGWTTADVRYIHDFYALRNRQIAPIITSAWSPRNSTQLNQIMTWQAGAYGSASTITTYRLGGADLTLDASGNYCTGGGCTIVTDYTSAPNRPYDVIQAMSYAPYWSGAQVNTDTPGNAYALAENTQRTISTITNANPGVVTIAGIDAAGWANGDRVEIGCFLSGNPTGCVNPTGMTQLAGVYTTVANLDGHGPDTFELSNTVTGTSSGAGTTISSDTTAYGVYNASSGKAARLVPGAFAGLISAADQYALGDAANQSAAIKWWCDDMYSGTNKNSAGVTNPGSQTINFISANMFPTWQAAFNSAGFTKPLIQYENGYSGYPPTVPANAASVFNQPAMLGLDGTYATKFQNLYLGFMNSDCLRQGANDMFLSFKTQTNSLYVAQLMLSSWPGGALLQSNWAMYPTDPFSIPFQSYVGTANYSSGRIWPYLLNRDLDPAANDNTPAFLNKAA